MTGSRCRWIQVGVSDRRVSDSGPVRVLTLEIDAGGDPISGRVRDGAPGRQFVGWLGLARALELVLDARERASAR